MTSSIENKILNDSDYIQLSNNVNNSNLFLYSINSGVRQEPLDPNILKYHRYTYLEGYLTGVSYVGSLDIIQNIMNDKALRHENWPYVILDAAIEGNQIEIIKYILNTNIRIGNQTLRHLGYFGTPEQAELIIPKSFLSKENIPFDIADAALEYNNVDILKYLVKIKPKVANYVTLQLLQRGNYKLAKYLIKQGKFDNEVLKQIANLSIELVINNCK